MILDENPALWRKVWFKNEAEVSYMGLRFKKSIKLGKAMKINLGKTGASLSFGTKGMRHTIHTSGRKTTSVGLPGTGLSFVNIEGGAKKRVIKKTNRSEVFVEQCKMDGEYCQDYEMIDEYNNLIESLRSIHTGCSASVNWEAIRNSSEPFDRRFPGPFEMMAQEELETSKPNLLERIFPAIYERKINRLFDAVTEAREKDLQDYESWSNSKELAKKIVEGDIESYMQAIAEMNPFDVVAEFCDSFNIKIVSPEVIEIEFHAKTTEVVPNRVLSLTETGRFSSKQMTKSMYHSIVQDYVCGCTLRIARETFAFLPVRQVVIHAVDTVVDRCGCSCDAIVLSVVIQRDEVDNIDFDGIDATNAMERFKCNMIFRKTQGLKAVPKVQL